MTHASENITLPQTSFAGSNNVVNVNVVHKRARHNADKHSCLITSNLYATIANLRIGKEMYFEVGCCTFTLCNTKFTSIFYIITKKNQTNNADDLIVIAFV